jgi:hypothetical protein
VAGDEARRRLELAAKEVEVAAANARRVDAHQRLAWGRSRLRAIENLQRARFIPGYGLHDRAF